MYPILSAIYFLKNYNVCYYESYKKINECERTETWLMTLLTFKGRRSLKGITF